MRSLIISIPLSFLPSPIRIFIYRRVGAKIGKRVKIGIGTIILANSLEIGDNTTIGSFNLIKVNTLSLGKYVSVGHMIRISVYKIRLDSRARISSTAQIAGDPSDEQSIIKMGMHSWIFPKCFINVTRQVTLGRNVGVGGGTYLFTHGYWLSKLDGFPVKYGSVSIADNVWIPWGCFIMPGVKIGTNVIVGARSLVRKNIPDNALVAGMPARIIKNQSFKETRYEEKMKILTDSVYGYSEKINKRIDCEDTDTRLVFKLNQKPFITVHKKKKSYINERLYEDSLNIFFDGISTDTLKQYPCFILNNYLSSSVDIIPKNSLDWLEYNRCIGMRYYPIDELDETTI